MARVGAGSAEPEPSSRANPVYAKVANRLSELIDDVSELGVNRDEKRELLTLFVSGKDGTAHPARALSDGTLRFLALAVLDLDPEAQGLLCLEEPENGIHPLRIPAILDLVQDLAVDSKVAVDSDNPLRQVIINTHSPAVVGQVPDDCLLLAELTNLISSSGVPYRALSFSCLSDTWRDSPSVGTGIVSRGKVLEYLNPVSAVEDSFSDQIHPTRKRVMDRNDLQLSMTYGEE
jgi:hypothetical protein